MSGACCDGAANSATLASTGSVGAVALDSAFLVVPLGSGVRGSTRILPHTPPVRPAATRAILRV